MQKQPNSITVIRHVTSAFNMINKNNIQGYREFSKQFDIEYKKLDLQALVNESFPSEDLLRKVKEIISKLIFNNSDYDTGIADGAMEQAVKTGSRLSDYVDLPDTIYVSPYKRAKLTLEGLKEGWSDLKGVTVIEDDRIREQEYGMQNIYADWRVYFTLNPKQALLRKHSTEYEYRQEQGESLLDVRNRLRSFLSTIITGHGGKSPKDVMVITHHLAIMAMRANIERWNREVFLDQNRNNRPPNSSITTYVANESDIDDQPDRLALKHENLVLF